MSGSAADAEARGAWLQSATGGNPLFVRELAAQSAKPNVHVETPPSLREAVRRRLARLSSGATRALRACAMMGAHASIGALIEVLECEPSSLHEVLEELDQEGLVANDAASPLWVHEVIGQEVLDQSSPAVIRLLHFQVGAAIAKRATDSWSPRLAWDAAGHLAAAGEKERAVSLLVQTANHQNAIGMPAAAATTFRRAYEISDNKEQTGQLLENEIRSLAVAGDWTLVELRLQDVDARPRIGISAESADELTLIGFRAEWHLGRNYERTYESVLAFARRPDVDLSKRARAVAFASVIGDNLMRREFASIVEPIIADIEHRSPEPPNHLLEAKAIVAFARNELDHSAQLFARLAESCRRSHHIEGHSRSLIHVSIPLELLGKLDSALEANAEGYNLASSYRMASVASRSADRQSGLLFDADRMIESDEWIERASHWNENGTDPTYLRSIQSQRMKLYVHARLGGLDDGRLENRFHTIDTEGIQRVRLSDLAILMYWKCGLRQLDDAVRLLSKVAEICESMEHVSRSDYVAAAVEWTEGLTGVKVSTQTRQRLDVGSSAAHAPWYRVATRQGNHTQLYRDLRAHVPGVRREATTAPGPEMSRSASG
jgi:hypothetical protein